jgi:uncharacterized membrane protein
VSAVRSESALSPRRFRERGGEITRLEGFSDCAFGFALTLIVVSLEVPKSFDGLVAILKGFPSFAVSFAILAWIWYCHHRFFRRFGLQDNLTIFLNMVLLFVVLFYVYPLKFLYAVVSGEASGLSSSQAPLLFLVYGAGWAAVFLVFLVLHLNALRLRESLELDEFEVADTKLTIAQYAGVAAVGLISAGVAQLPLSQAVSAAGFCYFASGVPFWLVGRRRGQLSRRPAASERPPAESR